MQLDLCAWFIVCVCVCVCKGGGGRRSRMVRKVVRRWSQQLPPSFFFLSFYSPPSPPSPLLHPFLPHLFPFIPSLARLSLSFLSLSLSLLSLSFLPLSLSLLSLSFLSLSLSDHACCLTCAQSFLILGKPCLYRHVWQSPTGCALR